MGPGVGIPLMVFVAVVIIVALVALVRTYDLESDARQLIHRREMEHREAMERLEIELREVRAKSAQREGAAGWS